MGHHFPRLMHAPVGATRGSTGGGYSGITQSPFAGYESAKQVAARMQGDAARRDRVFTLQQQRDELIKAGVMPSAIPHFDEHTSPADMDKIEERVAGLAQARRNAPAAAPVTAPAPVAATPSALEDRESQTGLGQPDSAQPGNAPLTPPVAAPGASRTALENAMDKIPLPNGATPHVTQTGAGMVATVPSESGPREVAVTPSFDQVMHARTGGKWSEWTPAQRAQYLRSNPAPTQTGETIDTGATGFNHRGERVLGQKTFEKGPGIIPTPVEGGGRTAEAIEYDPRRDTMGGQHIADKYGAGGPNGVRFVTPEAPAAYTGGFKSVDELGAARSALQKSHPEIFQPGSAENKAFDDYAHANGEMAAHRDVESILSGKAPISKGVTAPAGPAAAPGGAPLAPLAEPQGTPLRDAASRLITGAGGAIRDAAGNIVDSAKSVTPYDVGLGIHNIPGAIGDVAGNAADAVGDVAQKAGAVATKVGGVIEKGGTDFTAGVQGKTPEEWRADIAANEEQRRLMPKPVAAPANPGQPRILSDLLNPLANLAQPPQGRGASGLADSPDGIPRFDPSMRAVRPPALEPGEVAPNTEIAIPQKPDPNNPLSSL